MGNDSKLGSGAVGLSIEVQMIETVTGDFMTEAGEPFWRIEIDGYCADFDSEAAATNFAAAIGKLPDLFALLREFVDAMERYQMDVDGDATPRHRDMMERAYALLPLTTQEKPS